MAHRRRRAVAAVLAVLAAAACALPRPAAADDALTVVLGKTVPALMDTLDLVAQGAGFYADEHLTVTKLLVDDAGAAAAACSSGAGDVCPIGIEPVFTGYAQGVRMQAFLARAARYTYVLAVLDASPIATLADFKGTTVGVHTLGLGQLSGQVAVTSMLATAGLQKGDYTLAAIGFDDPALQALTSGRVAAAGFPSYELIPYQLGGTKLRVFAHPLLADVVNAVYAAGPQTIRTKADQLKRFSRAIVKAALLVRLNPAASARLLLQAHGDPVTDAGVDRVTRELTLWEDALPARDAANRRIGYMAPADEDRYIRLLVDGGVLTAPMPASAILTNDFVAFANDFDHKAFAHMPHDSTELSIVLGKPKLSLMDTLYLTAQGAGFFEAEGVTVTTVRVGGAAEATEVCSDGRGDLCPMGIEVILTGYERGIRLQLFLARERRFTYVLCVPEESPVTAIADLKGCVIGVHLLGPGGAGQVAIDSMMAAAGLRPGEYAFVPIGYEHDAWNAVTAGRVAAAAFPSYDHIPLRADGVKMRILTHPILADVVNGGYAAAPATIEKKAGALGGFSRAIVKAALLVHDNAAAAARLVFEAYGAPFTAADVEHKTRELMLWQDTLPAADPANPRIGEVSAPELQRYIDILASYGVIKQTIPATAVVSDRFIAHANDIDRMAFAAYARTLS
jgi:NitT/TauT family transport system substrate-binding protein